MSIDLSDSPQPSGAAPDLGVAVVLAADQPNDLAGFYGSLLEQAPQRGSGPNHCRLPLPQGGWLEVYRPSQARPQPRQRGRLALCLQRKGGWPELQAWIERAQSLGAQLLDGPRQEPFGVEAWLLDPEGNGLLLLVYGP
ncbi:MAG: hypothetical protein RLZZ11_422 [Cyanobacteriota bacterium]|jgi:predicted enzyme related to lactoylglutathione lyase